MLRQFNAPLIILEAVWELRMVTTALFNGKQLLSAVLTPVNKCCLVTKERLFPLRKVKTFS